MRIPAATYRIQFNADFPFDSAKKIIAYLAELGISDLYASPIFKAREGSTHGYDVVDPTQLNPELGTPEKFEALVNEIKNYDMGWVQDIVPNHMAYDSQNQFLMDILENGPNSEYFDYFDIDWNHPYENLRERVLAPMLGNFYGDCLENAEIQLQYDQSGLSVNYFSLKLPVKIESYAPFITHNLGKLAKSLGRNHPDFVKLLGILYLLKNTLVEPKGKERYDQIAFVKGLLGELYTQNPEVQEFIDSNIEFFNGEKGNPESFNSLDRLLSEQFYRLSFWKVGAEELNYRRFFTVNELISVKAEEIKVFHKTHNFISQLVESGTITGLRIDHIDGLYDPSEYLQRLRNKAGDVYITVEKILEHKEDLPAYWPIEGTSGYDFLNYVNGIFCRTESEEGFTEIYSRLTGLNTPYEQLFMDKKRLIVEKNMAGDVDNLAHLLKRVSGHSRVGIDFTQHGLQRALAEILILFPVYRTYINQEGLRESDRFYVKEVIEKAREQVPLLLKELNYIEKLLLLEEEDSLKAEQREVQRHFVMRLQQLTGPLMAKGIEDTLLYVYNRLLSLNEVGGNPSQFGVSVADFHEFNQKQHERWPHKMNATATHDTKRGEDVRARINVLSEIPDEWEEQVKTWSKINDSKKRRMKGRVFPQKNDEYFFYQTLVGAFPFAESERSHFVERVKEYVVKAVREAKVHTAWLRPDTDYEDGFVAFIEGVLKPSTDNQFLQEFLSFQQSIAYYGIFNSLSQTLLKITASGVPDFYQGTELWELSLVDPDNRRPVDFEQRLAFLKEIKEKAKADVLKLIDELFTSKEDGRIKLFLIARVLEARKQNLAVFQKGDYVPLEVDGKFQDRIVAFARSYENRVAITIVPRLLTNVVQEGEYPLGEVWGDTRLKLPQGMPSAMKDAITSQSLIANGTVLIGDALKHFPVALLISESDR
ncbi:malto-oligosyltrehalose synthase [Coleofasciculus sp. FACHB-64]|uniref:malto-oligosyltrehalose synthase n=1 Tax=Cyanophyceae TaxID=3028117 RepID=UPI001684D108|nr:MULTISPECIES: malto-oligosyltrehalose synthase [unclassified Coleofasciculus]MBD1838831.1 malto-oligosyltrehalose synthase [Coleofasciculus sp. FACHB-501]MBD2048048.1 malto-oligosyltrehalose synthase [Coleofasciculus sp. FACHB-64]